LGEIVREEGLPGRAAYTRLDGCNEAFHVGCFSCVLYYFNEFLHRVFLSTIMFMQAAIILPASSVPSGGRCSVCRPIVQRPLSRDPSFLEKLTDVVGLYLNPPDKAIVLCVDEKRARFSP
jgi:hypothetical protein